MPRLGHESLSKVLERLKLYHFNCPRYCIGLAILQQPCNMSLSRFDKYEVYIPICFLRRFITLKSKSQAPFTFICHWNSLERQRDASTQ